jgi:Family of unknown function (DUF6912)
VLLGVARVVQLGEHVVLLGMALVLLPGAAIGGKLDHWKDGFRPPVPCGASAASGDFMRVYLPTTLTALACLLRAGAIGPAPVRGYAVTPALREWYASGDLEELEYVAMAHAARASLRLLADDPQAPRRRVVLAADVPDEQIGHDGGFDEPTLVEVSTPVPMDRVASAHVDDLLAVADIAKAAAALPAADKGDDDAQFAVDGAEGRELLWYASQELGFLT